MSSKTYFNAVDDEGLGGFEQDLLRVKIDLGLSLDLFLVMMIDLSAMVEHVSNVGHSQTLSSFVQ